MKTKFYFVAALAATLLASCADDKFVGDNSPNVVQDESAENAINFAFNLQNVTRADELVGATAAEKLGGMFVVEGTKGSEQTNSPSTDVVFDNYLVGYTANTAGTTESNTHNWEYVGLQSGITTPLRMSAATWTNLHGTGTAQKQTIKYWDQSTKQYDFIAWSTGTCEAIPIPSPAEEPAAGKIQVSRIATGETLKTSGFTMKAASATDLEKCYYTDINTVKKAKYNEPVVLRFKNMVAKVRVALYETVPGYSVKDVKFYPAEAGDPTKPNDLGTHAGLSTTATLFTTGDDEIPTSGTVTVMYPRIGTAVSSVNPLAIDYNKASVSVANDGATKVKKLEFDVIAAAQLQDKDDSEAPGSFYLGRNLPEASFAGDAAKNFYTAVFPNTTGKSLTLRVDYTLVSIDGSGEAIKVYGAKAVVPATYTKWMSNYAYTYIFKISDNSNGWTSDTYTDPKGLFPITFDAVVINFEDANAEQTTVTTVATPSITTYQQGHVQGVSTNDEYSKSQLAGADQDNVKDLYVQVMDNSGATPSLKENLTSTNSLLYKITKTASGDDYVASEAEVMDALQNRTNDRAATSPEGRNGITLTAQSNGTGQLIDNTVTQIVNGVDDQPINLVTAGKAAKIDIDNLTTGPYAYVYVTKPSNKDEKIYHKVSATEAAAHASSYYPVTLPNPASAVAKGSSDKAVEGKVYFVKNVDADGNFVSWTFKQTKINESVAGLYEADVPSAKEQGTYDSNKFYFDVYNQNDGEYAVKVIKVVN